MDTAESKIIRSPTGLLSKTLKKLEVIAKDDKASILFIGDTGTGKELLAQFLVDNSQGHKEPYKKINCMAFP